MSLIPDGRFEFWTPDLDGALDLIYKIIPEALCTTNADHETIYIYHPAFGALPCGYICDRLVPVQFSERRGWEPIPFLTKLPRHRGIGPVKHATLMFTASPVDETDRILKSLLLSERAVLGEIVRGHSNKQIAKMLDLTESKVQEHVRDLAKQSGIPTADPQIELTIKFCRLVPRVAYNDEACRRWEAWKDIRKECLLGWINARSMKQIAAAVGRKKGTVRRYLSDMNVERKSDDAEKSGSNVIDEEDGTRLQWVSWYIANFFPAIERLNVVRIALEDWSASAPTYCPERRHWHCRWGKTENWPLTLPETQLEFSSKAWKKTELNGTKQHCWKM
jgi:hypothetical protein